jgi:hypothetical protein
MLLRIKGGGPMPAIPKDEDSSDDVETKEDREFDQWSAEVAQEMVDNLNRNVIAQDGEDNRER